jgi:hypothetical protein
MVTRSRPSRRWLALLLGASLAGCDREPGVERTCRIEMLDSENLVDTTLEVAWQNAQRLAVTNGVRSASPVTVPVELLESGTIRIELGVPQITEEELLQSYVMQDDPQLTFLAVDGCPCSAFERSLIYFMVFEWFYFG